MSSGLSTRSRVKLLIVWAFTTLGVALAIWALVFNVTPLYTLFDFSIASKYEFQIKPIGLFVNQPIPVRFRFEYPAVIQINQSKTANLYILFSRALLPRSDQHFSVKLYSTNFTIKPAEKQRLDIIPPPMETKVTWLMEPEKTGEHILLLDLSSMVSNSSNPFPLALEAGKEEKFLTNPADAIVELPVCEC